MDNNPSPTCEGLRTVCTDRLYNYESAARRRGYYVTQIGGRWHWISRDNRLQAIEAQSANHAWFICCVDNGIHPDPEG